MRWLRGERGYTRSDPGPRYLPALAQAAAGEAGLLGLGVLLSGSWTPELALVPLESLEPQEDPEHSHSIREGRERLS